MAEKIDKDIEDTLVRLLGNFLANPSSNGIDKQALDQVLNDLGVANKTIDDIRKEYQTNLASDLAEIQREARQKRSEELLNTCEISEDWVFERIQADSPEYYNNVLKARYWIENFESYKHKRTIIRANREMHVKPGAICYIYGQFGVGKSMLAGSMARLLIQNKLQEVIFTQWHTISRKMQALRVDLVEYSRYQEDLVNVDLLIIDEVAVDKNGLTEAQRRDLGELLRARKNVGTSTILISNAAPDELIKLLGNFCNESLKNYEDITVIQLTGPNRRDPLRYNEKRVDFVIPQTDSYFSNYQNQNQIQSQNTANYQQDNMQMQNPNVQYHNQAGVSIPTPRDPRDSLLADNYNNNY